MLTLQEVLALVGKGSPVNANMCANVDCTKIAKAWVTASNAGVTFTRAPPASVVAAILKLADGTAKAAAVAVHLAPRLVVPAGLVAAVIKEKRGKEAQVRVRGRRGRCRRRQGA